MVTYLGVLIIRFFRVFCSKIVSNCVKFLWMLMNQLLFVLTKCLESFLLWFEFDSLSNDILPVSKHACGKGKQISLEDPKNNFMLVFLEII